MEWIQASFSLCRLFLNLVPFPITILIAHEKMLPQQPVSFT